MADLPDPSTLTDEELDRILAGDEPEPDEPTPDGDEPEEKPEPKKPSEKDEPEADPKNEKDKSEDNPDEPEDKPKDDRPPSRREQMRVQQLLEKLKETPLAPKPTAPESSIDYEKSLDADPETIKKLEEDRKQSNESYYNQGLEQANSIKFLTRLEIDAPRVETKYKFLDKTSDEFNPLAADALNTRYLQFVGYDPETQRVQHPDIRYSDFVEAEMEFANEIASRKITESTTNIKKQAARTGLRPDGSGAKKMNLNKAPEDMTDEELDAYLDQNIPKR